MLILLKFKLRVAWRLNLSHYFASAIKHKEALKSLFCYVQAEEIMKQTYSVLPIYEIIISVILKSGVRKLPEICNFTLGVPVGPMLAKPTTGVSEVLNKFQDMEFSCEYKYDGERAQVATSSTFQFIQIPCNSFVNIVIYDSSHGERRPLSPNCTS